MQNNVMCLSSRRLGAAMVLSLSAFGASAQGMSGMPGMASDPKTGAAPNQAVMPTHAQMQQEIDALRAQVQQLQQAHNMPMNKAMKPGMGMKNMPGKKGKPPAAAPMKPGGMMDDDAMEMPMPPADGADPAPMPMPDM